MTITGAFRACPTFVVFDGQSLLLLPGGGVTLPAVLMASFPGVKRNNRAVGSTSWTALAADVAQRRNPYLKIGVRTVLYLLGGQSDLATELDSGATVAADQAAYATSARAVKSGLYVIGTTIPPSTAYTAPMETARLAANTAILAGAGTTYDAVVDLANTAGLTDPAGSGYSDGLHFSALGCDLAAAASVPAMTTALG